MKQQQTPVHTALDPTWVLATRIRAVTDHTTQVVADKPEKPTT